MKHMTDPLLDFLTARLDEDEMTAEGADKWDREGGIRWAEVGAISEVLMIGADRVLREVAAKRAIIGRISQEAVLRYLASVYADHPDYDEAWAAETAVDV